MLNLGALRERPLTSAKHHPTLLLLWCRCEDIPPSEAVHAAPPCDRDVTLYGYVRGCNWKEGTRVHIAGVGDYPVRHKQGRAGRGRPG